MTRPQTGRLTHHSYSIVYSPDDDGWYVDFFETRSGRTVEFNDDDPLFDSEREARAWAEAECHQLDDQAEQDAYDAEVDRRVDAYLEDGIRRPHAGAVVMTPRTTHSIASLATLESPADLLDRLDPKPVVLCRTCGGSVDEKPPLGLMVTPTHDQCAFCVWSEEYGE